MRLWAAKTSTPITKYRKISQAEALLELWEVLHKKVSTGGTRTLTKARAPTHNSSHWYLGLYSEGRHEAQGMPNWYSTPLIISKSAYWFLNPSWTAKPLKLPKQRQASGESWGLALCLGRCLTTVCSPSCGWLHALKLRLFCRQNSSSVDKSSVIPG